MNSVKELGLEMINELLQYQGKTFSDNFSSTGSSLCLSIDTNENKVYYQECYSQYSNLTGKTSNGSPRTDKLKHPASGLKTMSLSQFYGAAIGWV